MEIFNQLTEWMDKFTIWVAFGTLFFTWRSWQSDKNGKVDIAIELRHHNKIPIKLEQTIKRRHLTRSEVQGVLANAYHRDDTPRARYDIPFLASKSFSQRLESVQDGKSDILIIDIDNLDEFLAFGSE